VTTTTTIPESTRTDTRPVRRCEACGERAGSISAGTGRPLVRDRESGLYFHLSCKPAVERRLWPGYILIARPGPRLRGMDGRT
jgi:hypothetical protein